MLKTHRGENWLVRKTGCFEGSQTALIIKELKKKKVFFLTVSYCSLTVFTLALTWHGYNILLLTFFLKICVVQHQVLYTGQTVLKEIRRVSSSGWWTCKSLWFGTDSPNCIQPLTTIVSLQPPSSIRTSTRTGTWVHTGGEEVAGFTSCRGLAQGPSYDWLGDWDMSLSMISFTVKGDKQKKNINKYSKL